MKICFISDTHNLHHRISMMLRGGDVIVHSGDMTGRGTKPEIVEFLDWYKSLNYTHKIFIAGNHDWGFQDEPEFYKNLLKTQYPDLIYLEDSSVTIDGVKFYGSPWPTLNSIIGHLTYLVMVGNLRRSGKKFHSILMFLLHMDPIWSVR